MGSSGGQQPVTQQTQQSRDPWGPAQPALQQAIGAATNLYNAGAGYVPYTGNTTAGINSNLGTAWDLTAGLASAEPYGSTALQGARGYLGDLVSNQGLSDPLKTMASTLANQQNPYLQGALDQQMAKANSAMSGAGRYGSGMHDAAIAQAIAPTLAQDYMQRQGMAADIYTQGLQRAGQASQLIPSLDEARFANMNRVAGIGDIYRNQQQAQLDAALKLYNAQQAYPWEQLQRYNALVGGAGSLGGTQVTSSPGATQPSGTQRML